MGNSKGTDLSEPVFFARDYPCILLNIFDPGKCLEHCYVNGLMYFYMDSHVLTHHKLFSIFCSK